ncbi:leucine-rich repeat-containing protein 59-like [Oppia nitens]|uniref:leucine-rich repeat-containing protein 59-like n=1 Tax=Oppia nitens TaxID=1686743 RepID=UPI0023DBD567|nr:leucine-rich repeat-containing protein 59-like [Oppia nitens]
MSLNLRKHDHTMDGSDWDLSMLSLKEAPVDDLQRNPKARRVDLSNNSLVRLPDSFTSLTHLVVLDLSKNQLRELPQRFGDLNKLVRLDLYSNQLRTLPLSFIQLSKLKWLDLKGNPLDQNLAKFAGDCANQRQCELCAVNCLKFVKNENIRTEKENNERQKLLQEKQELERRLEEKNRKEKEKRKAKNARRSARKVQQLTDNNSEDNDEAYDDHNNSDLHSKRTDSKRSMSFINNLFGFILFLLKFFISLSVVVFMLFIMISLGLYLQNGHKLHTFDDILTATVDGIKLAQNYEQFMKETTTLVINIVNNLKQLYRQMFTQVINGNQS